MGANFHVSRLNRLSMTLVLASLVLVVGILSWAREVLIPIALAVLLEPAARNASTAVPVVVTRGKVTDPPGLPLLEPLLEPLALR